MRAIGMRTGLLLIAPVLAFLGCADKSGFKDLPRGTRTFCENGSRVIDGPYIYENNQWGKSKAKDPFTQCILQRTVDGKSRMGWKWDWPGFDPTVFAYPEIIYGWKPWSGGATTDPKLPIKVTDIRTLTMRYDVDQEASGAYDLAPEIWLTDTPVASEKPNPLAITTEVMFWMDARAMQPAGAPIDKAVMDGVAYSLWKFSRMGDKGNGEGWVYFAFVSGTRQLKAILDLRAFLFFLLEKSLITPDNYLASIEFGSESAGGKGTVWIKDYAITLQ
jgi:hypothetical protein